MKYSLVVDDDKTQRTMLATIMRSHLDLSILEAENGQTCLDYLQDVRKHDIRLVILDINLPDINGLDLLPRITRMHPDLPVIVVTGTANAENAAQAIKMGATDFFSKPVQAERINISARNALRIGMLSETVDRLERRTDSQMLFSDLIGADGVLKPTIHIAQKAAASELPVLISGETGVGKEVFARAIHGESNRAEQPFIAVNCGAIPENLIESTLFGHEKGSFTGAVQKTLGKFREAQGGTIFLDEVGELPLDAQVRFLRVLQEQEIEPVGAGRSIPIDVRIISATNRDLNQEVLEGRFREDLYFRLNVFPVSLPPLRKRKEDIPELARHFVERFSVKNKTLFKTLSDEALQKLGSHHWNGNVRELENIVNRSLILSDGPIVSKSDIVFLQEQPPSHINQNDSKDQNGPVLPVLKKDGTLYTCEEIEHMFLLAALEQCDQNVSQTAKKVGIAKSTLYRKLNEKIK